MIEVGARLQRRGGGVEQHVTEGEHHSSIRLLRLQVCELTLRGVRLLFSGRQPVVPGPARPRLLAASAFLRTRLEQHAVAFRLALRDFLFRALREMRSWPVWACCEARYE